MPQGNAMYAKCEESEQRRANKRRHRKGSEEDRRDMLDVRCLIGSCVRVCMCLYDGTLSNEGLGRLDTSERGVGWLVSFPCFIWHVDESRRTAANHASPLARE
jgi:hypothetical protein